MILLTLLLWVTKLGLRVCQVLKFIQLQQSLIIFRMDTPAWDYNNPSFISFDMTENWTGVKCG